MRRSHPDCLRAAWWTVRAVSRARRTAGHTEIGDARLPRPPHVGAGAVRGVRGVLHRRSPTCLVTALVLQRWFESQGDRRDLVVGVTAPAAGFRAHAWLEGDEDDHGEGFVELFRRSPDGRLEGVHDRTE